jgi:6-phosphogluconate dehydrogenase
MKLGMIGMGRMGANMARRLMKAGHEVVAYDHQPAAAEALAKEGAQAVKTLAELALALAPPRAVWIMVPAGGVDGVLKDLAPHLAPGDAVIDGGNSHYVDDIRRAKELSAAQLHYVDAGTSGGVWGLERGYCQMIGGEDAVVRRLDPLFAALAPGLAPGENLPKSGDTRPARGYVHCGPVGAGHFVKMVHNGIEYGVMAAYAEGLNILRHANVGAAGRAADAETTPLEDPALYRYDLDLAAVTEAWRHGSVISSWLLDLAAAALKESPTLEGFSGRVSDSGEGRWTLKAAIDEGVPAPVLGAALTQRFASRGAEDYSNKLLSALRFQFGGHQEKQGGAA